MAGTSDANLQDAAQETSIDDRLDLVLRAGRDVREEPASFLHEVRLLRMQEVRHVVQNSARDDDLRLHVRAGGDVAHDTDCRRTVGVVPAAYVGSNSTI